MRYLTAIFIILIVPVLSLAQFNGPLVASSNSHYFTDGNGKAILLTGSHTFNNFQDLSQSSSPPAFDFTAYVNFLLAHGHNATIVWKKDLPEACNWGAGTSGTWFDNQWPFPRNGPGNATDGLPKFDLSQYNQSYFDRLRARVVQLQDAGIYAVIELFDGLQLENNRCSTDGYPYTGANNINSIDDGGGTNSMTMGAPNAITNIQDAYVRKVIDTLNDLPNVLWEISEEAPFTPGDSEWWQGHMIALIHTYEAGKPLKHPVDFPTLAFGAASILYNSNADMVSPSDRLSPTTSCGTGTPTCKVNINDSDHSYFGMWNDTAQQNRNYLWENVAQGNAVFFMDPYTIYWPTGNRNLCVSPSNGVCTGPDTRWDNFRDNVGKTAYYANRMNLLATSPQGSSCSNTGYCLSHNVVTGGEWLVYAPSGGTFTVNLSVTNHPIQVEWFNPSTLAVTNPANVNGGSAAQSFTPPFGGGVDAVLYLKDSITTATPNPRLTQEIANK